MKLAIWLAAVTIGIAVSAGDAFALQASGSLPIGPVPDDHLVVDEEFTVEVVIENTSSTTPLPGTKVAAVLTGATTVTLACTDSACLVPLTGTLAVLGCVGEQAGVTCAENPLDSNQVIIAMPAGGVSLGPGAAVKLATISLKAVAPVTATPNSEIKMPAATMARDITACEGPDFTACATGVTGDAGGSTRLFFPPVCGDGAVSTGGQETCDPDAGVDVFATPPPLGAGECRGPGPDADGGPVPPNCTFCGDGNREDGLELCDDGVLGSVTPGDRFCRGAIDFPGFECTACGDRVVQSAIGEECDDGNDVDTDGCRNDCTFPCVTNSDCNDNDPCTMEACVDNVCVPTRIPGCVPCTTPGDCDDGELCTTNTCVNDQCVWTPIEGCTEVPCDTPDDCDDQDGCTTDTCVVDVCVATPIPGCVPCETAQECDDQDPCTTDACVDNVCVPTPIPGCVPCMTPGDCDDGELCTTNTCVNDQCVWTPIEGCTEVPCDTPDDCDDQDGCTTDTCVVDVCVATPIPGCMPCETAQECDDGDQCTVDVCVDDACVELPSFLVKVRGQVGNFSEIYGNFGVNDVAGELRFGREVFVVDGASTSGDFVRIGNGSNIYDLFGNHVALGSGVIVRGVNGAADLPLTDPFCPVSPFECGTSRVTVGAGTVSSPLAPGVYGSVRVFNGGTLRLAPGEFTFCEIRTGRRASILTSGPTTINVSGKVRLSNGSVFRPDAGSPTPVMNVLGSQVRVGAGSVMQVHLSAPNAMLTMGRISEFRGTFCVLRTRSDKRIVLLCPPDERPPASPSGAFVD